MDRMLNTIVLLLAALAGLAAQATVLPTVSSAKSADTLIETRLSIILRSEEPGVKIDTLTKTGTLLLVR